MAHDRSVVRTVVIDDVGDGVGSAGAEVLVVAVEEGDDRLDVVLIELALHVCARGEPTVAPRGGYVQPCMWSPEQAAPSTRQAAPLTLLSLPEEAMRKSALMPPLRRRSISPARSEEPMVILASSDRAAYCVSGFCTWPTWMSSAAMSGYSRSSAR